MNKTKNTFENYPDWLIKKWQEMTDLLADLLTIPVALIMKYDNEYMEVFIASNTNNNPYHVGDKEKWYGLYCETVIKTQHQLLIPNACQDENWNENPDIKLGMIAYLGFPINYPDNKPFGTICILDNKENPFSVQHEKLMLQFKNVIELDLALMQSFEIKTNELSKSINEHQTELLNRNNDLKKAKEKVEESEEKYRLLHENAGIGIGYYNPDGIVISYNSIAAKNMKGLPKDFEGKSIFDLFPISEANLYFKRIQKAIISEEPDIYEDLVRLPFENKWFISSFAKIVNSKKRVLGVQIISHDITKIKQTEAELIKAKEKAEESDRLKTAFLQNMSHEIRTPLNAISGFSGLLNKAKLSDDKKNNFISIIQNSCKQLVSIVSDILTISSLETKQEKVNIEKVCINNIIVDLLAIFKQQSNRLNISLYSKLQLKDKQSEIYTDKTKIIQILTNLLTNALKFTHEGFIEFGYHLIGNELEFYVKDSGIGIEREFHEKIFDRFRQADKSINKLYGGTGLGLAISKAFVELLGGKMWLESELGNGSTFYFSIPYQPVNEIDKTTIPTKQNENFKTVMVAEDEEFNFLFIEELLIDMDIKLIHAKDGQETIDICKANPNIDLILMDIKMPRMTGRDAAKIIKELKPNLPIVAQTAYALEHVGTKHEDFFDDYLTKPINEDDLKLVILKYTNLTNK